MSTNKRLALSVFGLVAILYLFYTNVLTFKEAIPIPLEEFPEPAWRTPSTLDARTVVSTPFARFEIHKVRTESGVVVNDWLWTDERSHVNILVHNFPLCFAL